MTQRLEDDSTTPMQEALAGAKRCIPVCIAAGPFGALYGALATEAGLNSFEVALMSASVYAGASQLVGVDLFGQNIPAWVVVLSIFAVNFRHILYSAAVGQHLKGWSLWQKIVGFHFLIDPQFAEAERRLEQGKKIGFAWYMGLALPTWLFWVAISWVGAIFGNLLENSHQWGIDFLLPIYFLGLVLGFRKRTFWLPTVAVSAVAAIIAHKTIGSPWHVSLGATAGILFAAFFSPLPKDEEDQHETSIELGKEPSQ